MAWNLFADTIGQRQTFSGFYFFRQYNARLAVTKAALVHRFLTYLSRVCKSRLSIKTHYEFRLATMFYAPVTSSPFYGLYYHLRSP